MKLPLFALAGLALRCQTSTPAPRAVDEVRAPPLAPVVARDFDGGVPCRPRVEVRTVEAPGALLFRLCEDGRLYSGAHPFGQLDARPTAHGAREELRLAVQRDPPRIDPAGPAAYVVDPDGTLHGGPRRVSRRLTADGRVVLADGAVEITVGPDGVISSGEVRPRYRATPTTADSRRHAAFVVFVMHSLMQ